MVKKNIDKEIPEEIPANEKVAEILESKETAAEKPEALSREEIQKTREEIEKADLDDHLKMQVQSHAKDLSVSGLEEERKIKKLLDIAKAKGPVFAIHVAKKMNDPYLLDKLHDKLAQGGFYKNFKK